MASNPPFLSHTLLDLPGIHHGFFGRQGGISTGTYDSLNAGRGSDDAPENVTENRARIAHAMGTVEPKLLSLYQYHSTDVVTVTEPFETSPKADGMVTRVPGLALSALAADCGPVLLVDPKARIIGACHAGWRGALAGITDQTITAMEELGAERENIRAVLGPCISQASYEVGPEFRDAFTEQNPAYTAHFIAGKDDRLQFDLKAFILARLKAAGLTHIAALPDCTYAAPERYFSYRYNTHQGISDYGRNISTIILTE